jgi:hypothetical protein
MLDLAKNSTLYRCWLEESGEADLETPAIIVGDAEGAEFPDVSISEHRNGFAFSRKRTETQ